MQLISAGIAAFRSASLCPLSLMHAFKPTEAQARASSLFPVHLVVIGGGKSKMSAVSELVVERLLYACVSVCVCGGWGWGGGGRFRPTGSRKS
jgi:hypothetical protein